MPHGETGGNDTEAKWRRWFPIILAILAGLALFVWAAVTHPYLTASLVVVAAMGYGAWVARKRHDRWLELTRQSWVGRLAVPQHMARLSPTDFEVACAALFQSMGFNTSLTRTTGDDGVDIILSRNGRKDIVQCKHYFNRTVGNVEVRNLLGAKQDFEATEAYLLTSGSFSGPAWELARRNAGIHLWGQQHICQTAKKLMLQGTAGQVRDMPPKPRSNDGDVTQVLTLRGTTFSIRELGEDQYWEVMGRFQALQAAAKDPNFALGDALPQRAIDRMTADGTLGLFQMQNWSLVDFVVAAGVVAWDFPNHDCAPENVVLLSNAVKQKLAQTILDRSSVAGSKTGP